MASKIKTSGKFHGKSNKAGGGGRFAQMVASGKTPALAAFIGRKKYGTKKMAKFSAKGRARKVKSGAKKMLSAASKGSGSEY